MRKKWRIARKILAILGAILAILMMALATVICFSIQWMFDTWSNLTMDEFMFHLTAPLEGTNEGMVREYLNVCVAPALLVLILTVVLFLSWYDKRRYFILMGCGIVVSLAVSTKVVHGAWRQMDVGDYVQNQGTYSTFIDDNYVDPAEVVLQFPEQRRNLIYIFLESMEMSYADEESGGAFEKNVIPELTALAQENEDFSGEGSELNGGYAMPGTTWTMGALFAQTSGLPLNISIEKNSMDTQDSFFSGIVTLGDILENAGYSQTLMIGSDATFGGRRLYFEAHGKYEILDYNYARETAKLPEDYRVWWGYEDQKLFGFAKERLTELAESEQPFNLTLLTVDTHFEDGYVCELCRKAFRDNQYANVMACSSRQVSKFVKWIQEQSFYENTTIVIAGDHLTMDSDFCEDIKEYGRRVYVSFINPAAEVESNNARDYTTFDCFPTTLAAMGVEIEGERLGLGTNLFSNKPTLLERLGMDVGQKEMGKKSKLLEELANLDTEKPELLVREGKGPKADIVVEEYRKETGILPVTVSNFENIPNGVGSVLLAVWTEEDQSDLQWMEMEIREDSSYWVDIDLANFGYKTGDYYMHVYVKDGAGEQYMVGEVVGVIS